MQALGIVSDRSAQEAPFRSNAAQVRDHTITGGGRGAAGTGAMPSPGDGEACRYWAGVYGLGFRFWLANQMFFSV